MFRDHLLTRHFLLLSLVENNITEKQRYLKWGNEKACTVLSYKHRHMQTLITENHTLALGHRSAQLSFFFLPLISSVKQCSLTLQPTTREGHFSKPVTVRPYSCPVNQVTQTDSQPVIPFVSQSANWCLVVKLCCLIYWEEKLYSVLLWLSFVS